MSYLLRYSKRYCYVLEHPERARDLLLLNGAKRRLIMASLSALSKYLGVYSLWQSTVKEYGLKWDKPNPLRTVLSILNTDLHDTERWLFNVLRKLPRDARVSIAFLSLTGLRIVEACNSINLMNQLSMDDRLNEYLDDELMMLQHFKYPQIFLRNSKNAFISFISKDLFDLTLDVSPKLTHDDLKSRLRKRGFRIRLKELRKLYATTLRNNGIPSEVIDILQGRISSSIFLRFYYKPFLKEIKEKVMKTIAPLEKEILHLL